MAEIEFPVHDSLRLQELSSDESGQVSPTRDYV